uniref:protein SSX7-like n=1 Tax=Macaca mulatta TaxID=9544 RepID=UPI0010A25B0D|nr:protein SSX7-like [Macaca mulatta]
MSLILFICDLHITKIVPKKPAEEGNDSKGMSEASGPQNDGKQLCPPGKPSTSEKINKTPGNMEAQEKDERREELIGGAVRTHTTFID